MLWIEAVRTLSADLEDPFELEFVWRNLHELDKLSWLNLMREKITDQELKLLTENFLTPICFENVFIKMSLHNI